MHGVEREVPLLQFQHLNQAGPPRQLTAWQKIQDRQEEPGMSAQQHSMTLWDSLPQDVESTCKGNFKRGLDELVEEEQVCRGSPVAQATCCL